MVEKINEGRYRVVLSGEPKEIAISFGLKGELYRIISKGQIESFAISKQTFMDVDSLRQITDLNQRVDSLKKNDPESSELESLENELELVYAQAMEDLAVRQKEELFNATVKKIELTENIIADGIAALLTKRDERGIVQDLVTRDDVLWNPKYVDDSEVLIDLLQTVVDYLTSTLKKISKMKEAVDRATVDPNQKDNSQISQLEPET